MKDFKFCPMCGADLEWDNKDGRDRLTCKKCKWIDYRNPRPVVSCLVFNQRRELLLVKRNVEPCRGCWALPGGFIEIDETLREAGSRELLEETGLEGEVGRLIGVELQESEMYGAVLTIGVEFIIRKEDIKPGDDAMEAKFFPSEKLPDVPFQSQRRLIDEFLQL